MVGGQSAERVTSEAAPFKLVVMLRKHCVDLGRAVREVVWQRRLGG